MIIISFAIYIYYVAQANSKAKKVKEALLLKEKKEAEDKRLKELAERVKAQQLKDYLLLKEKQERETKRLKEQAQLESKRQMESFKKPSTETTNSKVASPKSKIKFRNEFIISRNEHLKKNVTAFYHTDYNGGGNWKESGTVENMIWTLKNDVNPFPLRLNQAKKKLEEILNNDLPLILNSTPCDSLTVCVVPRAKRESYYNYDQLQFSKVINGVVNNLNGFHNGIDYIKRHTDTKTTHLKGDQGGSGQLPYIGITKNTCTISREVLSKDILLIDDIYTKTINIDEDAIQALFDNGAKSVVFYAIGKTVSRF
jgi:hypothetical protein